MDWIRFLPVFVTSLFIVLFFLNLTIKLLKRSKSKSAISLSMVFILTIGGLVINVLYYPLTTNPMVYNLHLASAFLIAFGLFFLVIFDINLLN